MTDEQAIERIAQALANLHNEVVGPSWATDANEWLREARTAWNEVKAIAREDAKRQEDLMTTELYRDRQELYWKADLPA